MITCSVVGNVALVTCVNRTITTTAFDSISQLIEYYVKHSSLAGAWGSEEHLVALRELKASIDNTFEEAALEKIKAIIRNG